MGRPLVSLQRHPVTVNISTPSEDETLSLNTHFLPRVPPNASQTIFQLPTLFSIYPPISTICTLFFFLKDFIYLFLERGERRKNERHRNINVWLPLACPQLGTWPATQACALTRNQTSARWYTEPHQPGCHLHS